MTQLQLTLTDEECLFLKELLEVELRRMRVEEHRTRTPNYRKHVLHQEDLLRGVLDQLQKQPQLV